MDTKNYSEEIFEKLKHVNGYGQEFWYVRELQVALEYSQWRYLKEAIERAKTACTNSGQNMTDHFAEVRKMVEIGSNAKREIEDIELSRYACYLIVINGDSRKEVIALGQTYFAVTDLPAPMSLWPAIVKHLPLTRYSILQNLSMSILAGFSPVESQVRSIACLNVLVEVFYNKKNMGVPLRSLTMFGRSGSLCYGFRFRSSLRTLSFHSFACGGRLRRPSQR